MQDVRQAKPAPRRRASAIGLCTFRIAGTVATVLSGFAGQDRLIGDNVDFSGSRAVGTVGGNDRLSGDPGSDALFGGPADDRLDGGVHTDTCDGEAGTDTFARCENVFGSP